jgi:hypothetical protein
MVLVCKLGEVGVWNEAFAAVEDMARLSRGLRTLLLFMLAMAQLSTTSEWFSANVRSWLVC